MSWMRRIVSDTSDIAELLTERHKLSETNQTCREKNKLEEENKKCLKELDIEKEKITKEGMVELANLELKKNSLLKNFELEILSKKLEHEVHTQKHKMTAWSMMLDKGYDQFAINYNLAGMARTSANDKSITDGKFMDDLVRHKLALQGQQALPAPSTSTLATEVDSAQPETQDQENMEPEAE